MIAFVRGQVAAVTLNSAVARGRRHRLRAACARPAPSPPCALGQPVTLPTSMVVREESLTLFGFLDEDEKTLFELVQTASGVGPKLAQSMLAVLPPDDLRTAVAAEDVKTLTRVPGIGQKGAQRIILELKDRIGAPDRSRLGPCRPPSPAAGATRCTRVWSGSAGRPRTPTGAVEAVAPEAGEPARRGRAAPVRPAIAEQGMSGEHDLDGTDVLAAAEAAAPAVADRRRRRRRRAHDRGGAAPAQPRRGGRPGPRARPAGPGPRGGPPARPRPRPRAALRSARARQDHPGDDHRPRDDRAAAAHERPGDHPRRRPRGDPLRDERRRRALRRRDPPDVASGRGDALHGDGGLPGRRRHRQGPRRDRDPAGDPAVHPGRRDDPRGAAARPAARPVRLHRPPGVLRAARARPDRPPLRRACWASSSGPTAPPRSPRARAAPRASPTGCCAGCATSPRCAPTAS